MELSKKSYCMEFWKVLSSYFAEYSHPDFFFGKLNIEKNAPRSCPSRRRECRRSNGMAGRNGSTSRQTRILGKYTTQQWMPELEELISTSSEGVADRLIKQMDKWNEPKLKIIIVLFDLF